MMTTNDVKWRLQVTIFENVTVGTTLHRFSATDSDTGRNKLFTLVRYFHFYTFLFLLLLVVIIIYSFNAKLTGATFNNASTRYIINPKACKRKTSHSLSES